LNYAWIVPDIPNLASLTPLEPILSQRPNTSVMPKRTDNGPVNTLHDLVIGQQHFFAVNPNVDDLIVVAHGDDSGTLYLSLDSANPQPAYYESLQKADTNNTIRWNAALQPQNPSFRLESCEIGRDECLPFLAMLKQALGPVKTVSAPRFVHAFKQGPTTSVIISTDGSSMQIEQDIFEHMLDVYRITFKDSLKPRTGDTLTARQKVVKAFQDAQLTQTLDGTKIPDKKWEDWVPKESLLNVQPTPLTSQTLPIDVPVTIKPAMGSVNALSTGMGSWSSYADQYTFKVRLVGGSIPPKEADQIQLIPKALANRDEFKDGHLYPMFTRFHFKSKGAAGRKEFFEGFTWKPTPLPDNVLQFVGTRYRYEIQVPVLKPGTADELIYNYYSGSGAPTINFDASNQTYKLFASV
jgi:hypothetical protein